MEDKKWYKKTVDETVKELKVSSDKGLDEDEILERRELYGENTIEGQKRKTYLRMLINQFKDFMVIILIIAALLSGFLGEIKDSLIILVIVIVNAIIGVVQESKAEKSLDALKNMSKPLAKVIRNGKPMEIKSADVVLGDIIIFEAGDFVPADGRLIESANLKVEESALTGESIPIDKSIEVIEAEATSLGDRKNMVYSTSMITYGRGKAIVTGTGMNTEIGKIAEMLQKEEDLKTPLQEKLEGLGKILGVAALFICIIIFVIGYMQGRPPFDMFMLSVSLAVAAIPEGLPAIVTIVLSLGVQRMIKKNAIIRKLPAVETLGTASVICSDKTGTLTQNKMTVTKLYTYDVLTDKLDIDISDFDKKMAIQIGLLCNDSTIEEEKGKKTSIGDPTEVALVILGYEKGLLKKEEERKLERINEIPFDSDRKLMSTIHKSDQSYRVLTKGAPDILLERCNRVLIKGKIEEFTEEMKSEVKKVNEEMASKALRVLALAYNDLSELPNEISTNTIENDLVFVGLSGMIDPPREEVKLSVKECREAGIKPVMITGDYRITAIAIGKELGILQDEVEAIDGNDLNKMSDEELNEKVKNYSVYARVSPEHKVRIVKAWQNNGSIVAMTGDGVNDAPALKSANIGCAMGITGTDVSKEASDMILTDDNFSTIVHAVEEGRNIFDNIRKSIHYLLSSNVGEILTLFVALLFNLPSPLLPIHILWINLVTDSLPALALGIDPAEPGIMKRKPRDPHQSIFADGLGTTIIVKGIIIAAVTLVAFNIGSNVSLSVGRTMAFITLCFSQLINSFGVRSIYKTIFKIGILTNKFLVGAVSISSLLMISVLSIPFLRNAFELSTFSLNYWLIVLALAFTPMLSIEIFKLIRHK